MSNDNLDRLFEQKLSGHKIAPSAGAWNKLESRLQKKRKPFWLWSRMAAALLLLALFGWLVIGLVDNPSSGPNQVAEQDQISQPSTPEASAVENTVTSKPEGQPDGEVEQNNEILETTDHKISSVPLASQSEVQPSKSTNPVLEDKTRGQLLAEQESKPQEVEATLEADPNIAHTIEEKEEVLKQDETTLPMAAVTENSTVENVTAEKRKRTPIKITYKRSSGSSEQALLADDSETKKPTRIEKVWQKAKAIKADDLSIGKLRAAKDGLLAFRGDKNKQSKSN
ncbi:MAG: hypothetical protein ACR2MX_00615 [Cyclobacteriaceae bacterium]